MIESITSQSGMQAYTADIQKAEELLTGLNKEDANATRKRMNELLIEYILANMHGNSEGAKEIEGKIADLVNSYDNDMKNTSSLQSKLTSMQNDPTASGLKFLQSLIPLLQHDLKTGDLSNLQNLSAQQ